MENFCHLVSDAGGGDRCSLSPNDKRCPLHAIGDAILLDTFVPGKHGGTGMIHDWEASRRICRDMQPRRLILAGGLRPTNVQEAIRVVRPYAVDVSTGVESSPGVKSAEKMRDFIERVREERV